jgi:two-component system, sensor histidine kinase and response regulator
MSEPTSAAGAGATHAPLITVLVAGTQAEIGVADHLPPDQFQVWTIQPAEAPSLLRAAAPAVAILALDDPARLDLVRELASAAPPLLVLVPLEATDLVTAALAAGAWDYVRRSAADLALLPVLLQRAIAGAGAQRRLAELDQQRTAAPRSPAAQDQKRRIGRLAHDLRTPLTYLIGYSELLLTRDQPPAVVKQMAGEIFREAERMAAMVEGLRDMYANNAGDAPLNNP